MEEPNVAIKWNSNVNGLEEQVWRYRKYELFPPFLQKKPPPKDLARDEILVYEKPAREPIVFVEADAAEDISVCDHDFLRSSLDPQDNRGRPFVRCTDDCRTIGLICEDLRDSLPEETTSAAEIVDDRHFDVFEPRDDEDYESFEDLEEVDEEEEEEKERREKILHLWLNMCEDLLSLADDEEDPPDTTEPYLSHKLYLPYKQIPRARYFQDVGLDIDYSLKSLDRRPRSPIRKILPGRFNLKAAFKERTRRRNGESKECSSQLARQPIENQLSGEISSVVLQAIQEQATLTLMDVEIDTAVHTFVNIAVIWTLPELDFFNRDTLSDEQLRRRGLTSSGGLAEEDLTYCDYTRGMRKVLMGVYRPSFSHNIHTTLHRRLPWAYVSPSHERGHMKFYPNVRERIDEIVSKTIGPDPTYNSDVRCFHLRDISDKSYVAYRRTTKHFTISEKLENLFLQLISFT